MNNTQTPTRGMWSIFQALAAGLCAGLGSYILLVLGASGGGVPVMPMLVAVLAAVIVFVADPIDYPTRLP